MKAQWKKLRSTFRIKHEQVTSSRSGDGTEEMDGPNCDWPYYEAMLFLKDQFEPRPSSGNLNSSESSDFNFTSPEPSPHVPTPLPSPEVTLVDNNTFDNLLESLNSDSHSGESSQSVGRLRKKKQADNQQQFLALEQEKIQLLRDRSLRRNEERGCRIFQKHTASNQAFDG